MRRAAQQDVASMFQPWKEWVNMSGRCLTSSGFQSPVAETCLRSLFYSKQSYKSFNGGPAVVMDDTTDRATSFQRKIKQTVGMLLLDIYSKKPQTWLADY